jgi:hypothetical protein
MYLLTICTIPSASGHYVDEEGNASKSLCIQIYNRNMGFVDASNMTTNTYIISHRKWKWTKQLFFLFVHVTVLNAFITHVTMHSSIKCLENDLKVMSFMPHRISTQVPQHQVMASQHHKSLDFRHSNYWSAQCHLLSDKGEISRLVCQCEENDVGLCD